jgi:Flp pilus assembly protein TadD
MVAEKTLALTLVLLLCACNSGQGEETSHSLGSQPSWMAEIFDENKTQSRFEKLKSQKALGKGGSWVHMGLGRAYAMKGLNNLSQAAYQEVSSSHVNSPQWQLEMAALAYSLGHSELALARLNSLKQKRSLIFFDKALIQLKLGDLFGGVQNLEKSLRLEPRDLEALEFRAMLYLKMRRFREAEKSLMALLGLFPENQFAIKNLIWLKHSDKKIKDRNVFIKKLNVLDSSWPKTGSAVIQAMRDHFPYTPENKFYFRDWAGLPWGAKQ